MSLRALGRQFIAQTRNMNKPWIPGTPQHPQGMLFLPAKAPPYRPERAWLEAGRRRDANEPNPEAPWRTPFLQHHFLDRPAPLQRKLF